EPAEGRGQHPLSYGAVDRISPAGARGGRGAWAAEGPGRGTTQASRPARGQLRSWEGFAGGGRLDARRELLSEQSSGGPPALPPRRGKRALGAAFAGGERMQRRFCMTEGQTGARLLVSQDEREPRDAVPAEEDTQHGHGG